jgi:hypothetical protein
MTCSNCNSNKIDVMQIENMPLGNIVDLYRQGYKLSESSVESLAIKDISAGQYILLGVLSYGSYRSYKSKHNIWAIIFGGLALGSASGIYTNYKK